jgi:N-acyl-D-aspartate/D-glutamate deacylase/CubicO group peptidase (beta-lactamase class C family)
MNILSQSLRLLALLLASNALATDVSPPAEYRPIRDFIRQGVSANKAPSVALALIKDGRVIWAEGFGLADREAGRKATSDSIYLLASVSKPMAATGLMWLVDQGKLDLAAPANRYLPGHKLRAYHGSPDDITLQRLANHTSGLPVHWSFFYNGVQPPSRDESIRQYGFAYKPPGERWEYCNLAFGIIDHITAVVAGQPWRTFMERRVYDPLKMSHTSSRVRPTLEEHATAQYAFDAAGKFLRVAPYDFDHDGASANWSSANDLARFLQMHLNDGELDGKRVLSKESARKMRTLSSVRDPADPDSGNGVAWFVGPYMGIPAFAHSGGMPGVSTRVRGFPKQNCGYVILINASAYSFRSEIEKRLTSILIPEAKTPPSAKSKTTGASSNKPTKESITSFTGAWEGRLAHPDGDLKLKLKVSPDRTARVSFGDRPSSALSNVRVNSSRLHGSINTRLRTQPSYHGLIDLEFRLERRGKDLTGIAVAQARDYFSLSHWVELKRSGDLKQKPVYDLVIRNGRIVDGTGAPWFRGDLAINNGRIVKVGRLSGSEAKRTIDAQGLIVSPGFVDMMGQTATPFLKESKAGNNLLAQGITTILAGEGGSAAPVHPDDAKRLGWQTMGEYFALLEAKGLPINVVQTIGHTQVRRIVIGRSDREPSAEELKRMRAMVREAMLAGAIGVSTALIYPPAVYASTDEIASLCQVAGQYGGRYYTHMRNEGDRLLEAIDEALDIGRIGNTSVHIFHLKAAGKANWGKMEQAIARIKAARAAGQEVDADIYPYINNGLSIQAFIHPRHSAAGPQEFLRRIQSPKMQAEIRRDMEEGEGWENWFRHVGHDWNKVILGNIQVKAYREHSGKSLGEIARLTGKDPWSVFWDLVRGTAFALPESMTEANKMRAMREEFVAFCTDVGPAGGSRISSHPRGYGSFPRILARYVRDHGVVSLEKAIAKMSAVASNQILVHDRGRIAEGLAADIVVFDYDRINDRATFADPLALAEGVHFTIVNGEIVFEAGKFTGKLPGRVLRGPGYKID